MPLRIFEGRAGTGKTTACLREMKDCPSVLIVPEQYSFRMGKILLESAPVSGFDGAQVYSFRRLATLLEGEVGGAATAILSGSERVLLLSHFILKHKDKLLAIRPRISAAEEMGELLAEFKKYQVAPDELRSVAEELPDSLLKRKLADAVLLYEEYEKTEKKDGEDRLALLARNIPESRLLSGIEVYIDQFTGFSPQEMEIIRALLATAKRVTVVLTMDTSAEPQFELVRKTRKELASLARDAEERVEIVTFAENKKHKEGSALCTLEREFFRYPHTPAEGRPEDIEVFEASSRESEITHLAAGITRLLREGYRYGDIAVVSRESESYETEIITELGRFGIPYFLDKKTPLLAHRASDTLLAALSVVIYGWQYEDVFRYLKCGYSALSADEVDRLENYCLAAGIRGRAWRREEPWDMPGETFAAGDTVGGEEAYFAEMDALRRRVAEPLGRLEDALSGNVQVKVAAEALCAFIEDISLSRKLQREAEEGGRKGDEDAQVYASLLSVLRTLHAYLGEEEVSTQHFRELLETGLSQSAVGAIPHSLDHVQISDITRSKGSGAKVVFIIGVSDGIFPKQGGAQGFLSDSNRHLLEEKGIFLAPDSRGRAYMEQNLIYAALTAASDKLYISYPVTDEKGETLRPSRMIHRIYQIFPALCKKSDFFGTLPEDLVTTPRGTFAPLLSALRREKDGVEPLPKELEAALLWYREKEEWAEKTDRAERLLSGAVRAARLSEEEARALYGEHLNTSISRLETYRACPFQYFAKYGLRLRTRNIAGMDMTDSGSFLHKILEDFSREVKERGIGWRSLTDEGIDQLLDQVLPDIYRRTNAYLLSESPRMAFLLFRLRRAAKVSLGVVRDHISAGCFEPMGYEISFEEGGDIAPIKIPIRGGSITLRGKIDRADKLSTPEGTYFRVVDYKSGNKEFRLGDTYHGLSLQLAVYLSALCKNEEQKGEKAHPAGMLYFRIKDPVVDAAAGAGGETVASEIRRALKLNGLLLNDPEVLSAMDTEMSGWSEFIPVRKLKDGSVSGKNLATAEGFRALFSHVEDTVRSIAEEMLSGEIAAKPISGIKNPCTYCEYRDVCGFDDKIDCYRYDETTALSNDEVWKRLEVSEA